MDSKCIDPGIGKMLEEYLVGALDGEAEAVMETHLLDCSHCYAELERDLKIESFLRVEAEAILKELQSPGLSTKKLAGAILEKLEKLAEVIFPEPAALLSAPITRSENTKQWERVLGCLEQASDKYEAGDYEEALKMFLSLKGRRGLSPILDFYIGMCHYGLDQYEPAARCFDKISRRVPESEEYKWYLANTCLKIGDPDKAVLNFESIVEMAGVYAESATARLVRLKEILALSG